MDGDTPSVETSQNDSSYMFTDAEEGNISHPDNKEGTTYSTEDIGISEKDHVDVPLKSNEKEDEGDEKKDTEKPLLEDDSIRIDVTTGYISEDTPTLPLPEKKKKKAPIAGANSVEVAKQRNLPKYLFPVARMKRAWNKSSNVLEFLGRAFCIVFSTIGWFTCVGGIPFVSLVMLVMGCVYVNDCRKEPNIPVYLIVTGVLGTLQHIMAIWTKYVPRDTEGRLGVYRSYCRVIDGLFTLFLMIWFVLGCIWVYGIYDDVDLRHPEHDEYCNMTVYLFAFWLFNLTFILLALIVVLSLCFITCIIITPKKEENKDVSADA
ncbi:uncharacterized protein LOC129231311 [Uloborus diversus]|uniref:uncharacterized protein LOC129231311 n=1 Tax=Uloborus diversus TaxID=327109 RepID=UPI00240A0061|nr:uncharacterized protein LOC129231311 [Uloborus diversus]